MLKKFKVSNFKNFHEECVVDFTKVHDYGFNKNLIRNGLINKALLYGRNGSGKSNLGLALMDIAIHLSDNRRNMSDYSFPLNGDSPTHVISFEYDFDFNGNDVVYRYEKDDKLMLLKETITKNGKKVFEYNYRNNSFYSILPELETFNSVLLKIRNINNSVIKMIYGYSTLLPNDSPIKNIVEFANGMLWFRSVLNGFQFMGNTKEIEDIEQYIINKGDDEVKSFESFLNKCGLDYELSVIDFSGVRKIMAKFRNEIYPLFEIASTGTRSLWLFYYWTNKCENKITFLYLDEFDAFYHPSLAKTVLDIILKANNYQSIVTTHNTYLADNSIMRPDCYWIVKDGEVKSFSDRTSKIIREGHNLEKMMLGDEFQ